MIMKKSILTVLFALICTMGFSQVSFNVKAGLNLSSYIGENSCMQLLIFLKDKMSCKFSDALTLSIFQYLFYNDP